MHICIVIFGILLVFIPSGKDSPLAGEKIMSIEEIKPGMKGYGKTVFNGDRIEMFDVKVLGVLRNWSAKSHLILIEMSGGPLEKSGIISGMSGSPVYIDNRLIGAVAYGWTFAKDAIAGVTPIHEMQSMLHNMPMQQNDLSLIPLDWNLPPSPNDSSTTAPQATSFIQQESMEPDSNNIKLIPILSPLVVSGIDNAVLQGMRGFFSTFGMYPVQGGSFVHPANTPVTANLVAGSSVAAVLIKGDFNAAVVGTVTYTEGNEVLAFGHPFLQTGNTDFPMASAYVYAILTSQSNSVKMASPHKIVGRINQDRRPGVAGTLGESSRMIPCHIEVDGSQKQSYNFEVANNALLTPNLVLMAAQSAVLSTEKKLGEKSVKIRLSAELCGYEKPVVVENVFYELDQSWYPLNYIIQPFATVMNNQFQKVNVNRIDLKIKILDTCQTAYIEAVKVDKKQVKPGDTLRVDVRLKPFAGESFCQTVPMQIPEDVLPGTVLNVTACDATYGQALNMGRSAGKYSPTNFKQLLHYIENMEQNNSLMVRILLPKKGLTYKGEGFPSLPSSVHSIMSFSNQSGIGPLLDEVISRVPTTYILSGNQSIPVSVE